MARAFWLEQDCGIAGTEDPEAGPDGLFRDNGFEHGGRLSAFRGAASRPNDRPTAASQAADLCEGNASL